jgi:hypothetical protein
MCFMLKIYKPVNAEFTCSLLDKMKKVCYNYNVMCRCDGIGRRVGLKIRW